MNENGQADVSRYRLGETYRKTGDSENAMTYLSKAIELADPGSDVAEKVNASLKQLQ